jgi:P4 family phage/plasmid primase-like protien
LDSINVAASSPCGGAQICDLDFPKIAQALIFEYQIVSFKGSNYIYKDGMYREDIGTINKAIVKTVLFGCGSKGKESIINPTSQINHIITSLTTIEGSYPFNAQKNVIPVRNGVIKIGTNGTVELLEHSADYRFTYQLAVDYNPDVDTSAVVDYLNTTGCDKDVLLQMAAQTLLSKWGNTYKKCYLLKGEKNSGKTTFLDLLNMRFFGKENCSNIPLHKLINDNHSSSGIVGKLVNICDELSKIKLEDVGQFKSMTGGGMINIDRKYHDPYSYKCDVTFIFAANAYPPVSEDDPAFWERWMLVEFNEAHDIDPTFEERTFTDTFMSAFLNLVIERMLSINKVGIKSDAWNITREKWLKSSDPFYRYIRTCLERDVEAFHVTAELYSHYERHCKASNQVAFSLKEFAIKLQDFGGVQHQKTVDGIRKWGYQGFRIKKAQLS